MQRLTRAEFLEVLGLSSGAFDQLQHLGHVALAFGTPLPATKGAYLDLDLVAMGVTLGLTPSFGREISATIVATYFNHWATAVGHAEADPSQDFYLAVGGQGWDAERNAPTLLLVSNGTSDQIATDFRQLSDIVGYYAVNISDILRRIRSRARALGIDLSSPFFFPPDDERFHQIIARVKRERDERIARFRRNKNKVSEAQARQRRYNISTVPRLSNVSCPSEMQGMQ
jgi:hypothetical protein